MYKAFLNNELFFASDVNEDSLKLLEANVNLEAGLSGELDILIPPCNLAYGNFHKKIDDVTIYEGDTVIFSGRPYYVKQEFSLNQRVKCEGWLTVLSDSIIRPFEYRGTLVGLIQEFQTRHNAQVEPSKQFQIGNITVTDRNDYLYRSYTNYEKTSLRLKDLVSVYGGYPVMRKTNGTLFFDWIDSFTTEAEQEINFGENLLDVTQVEDSAENVTVLIPLGAEMDDETTGIRTRLTIASVNQGRDYLESNNGIATFGHIVDYYIWDDVTTPEQLLSKGQARLAEISKPKTRITITAADLANAGYATRNFHVGEKIKTTSTRHGITNQWFTCLRLVFDLLRPGEKQLTMESVVFGYIRTARDVQAQYYKLIEKVVSDYVTNTQIGAMYTQLNTKIEYNTTLIEQNAQAISLKAEASVVNGLGTRLTAAEGEITIHAGQIALKADAVDVTALGTRIGNVETDLDAAEAAILLKADSSVVSDLGTRIGVAEAEIDALDAAIQLKASQADLTSLGTRVGTVEADLSAAEAAILLKADTTVTDALGSRMSSAEANISANASAITLKADTTTVNALGTRMTAAENKITDEAIVNTVFDSAKYQELTYANNLLPKIYKEEYLGRATYEMNGITWKTLPDGSVIATGTSTGWSVYRITGSVDGPDTPEAELEPVPAIHLNRKKQYFLSGCPANGSTDTYSLQVWCKKTVDDLGEWWADEGEGTILWPKSRYAVIQIDIQPGVTTPANGLHFYPMLEVGVEGSDWVSTHDGTGKVAGRLNVAESTITQQASAIEAKVSDADITGNMIIGRINLNATTATIEASKINLAGAVTIADLTALAQASVVADVSTRTQFAKGISPDTAPTEANWSYSVPAWQDGDYIWSRMATTKTDAAGTTTTTFSTPVYEQNLTASLSMAYAATQNAGTAFSRSTYRYGTCATAAATAAKSVTLAQFSLFTGATVTVYFANANTAANPTLNVNNTGAKAIRVKGANIAAPYYWKAQDTLQFTYDGTYWVMAESSANSIIADWCYNNDITYINGGKLYAGTVTTNSLAAQAVTAAKINVTDLFSQSITATDLTITGGRIDMETTANDSVIDMHFNVSGSGVGLQTTISPTLITKTGYSGSKMTYQTQISSQNFTQNGYLTDSGSISTNVQRTTRIQPGEITLIQGSSSGKVPALKTVALSGTTNNYGLIYTDLALRSNQLPLAIYFPETFTYATHFVCIGNNQAQTNQNGRFYLAVENYGGTRQANVAVNGTILYLQWI